MNSQNNRPDNSRADLQSLIMGFRTTQLVHVAAKLNLADLIAEGPKAAEELAGLTGAHAPSLHRLMRALASLGIFREDEDRRFALTPMAGCLCANAAGSLRNLAILYGDEWLWRAYGNMLHSVMTGEPAFPEVHLGASLYAYLGLHAEAAAVFHAAMSGFSGIETAGILEAYDFSAHRIVVDVGGGHGSLIAALLKTHPHLSGMVLDVEGAAKGAEETFSGAELSERAKFVAGDFFKSVPAGGDLYVLKSVIHNWDDEAAMAILTNCRAAMDEGARLLLIERIVPLGNEPSEAKLFDINMMVTAGGCERTECEYRLLLERAGFSLKQIIPTHAAVSVIEAAPA